MVDPPPPPLPPKRRLRKTSSSTSNSDKENSYEEKKPKKIQRRDCQAIVENLTYAQKRCLPSPPSEVDKARVRRLSDQLSVDDLRRRVHYCPLCPRTFGRKVGLECHLLSTHANQIQRSAQQDQNEADFVQCPYCRVKFLGAQIALNHLICHHPGHVERVLVRDVSGGEVSCAFCDKLYLRRHRQLLLRHGEHFHPQQLQQILLEVEVRREPFNRHNWKSKSLSAKPSSSSSAENHDYEIIDDFEAEKEMRKRQIRKRPKKLESDEQLAERRKSILMLQQLLEANSPFDAKRKTRSDKPDEPAQLFKCNLCSVKFLENAFLLSHMKNKHRRLMEVDNLLRPRYSCGACPAKFFQNRFLVKHAQSHQFQLVNLRE